jgi:anti-sigma B factor antagonist
MQQSFEASRENVTRAEGEIVVLRIRGYLDAHTTPDFERVLSQARDDGALRIVIDCSGLNYISSAGLGLLVDAFRAVKPKGGELKVAAMTPAIADIFDILGFSKVIPVYDTVEDAVEAFGTEAEEGSPL